MSGVAEEKFAKLEVTSKDALWEWLAANHAIRDSVWLVTHKAQSEDKYISRETVLDALIAHGWIDGVRRKLDADRTMQLISPRKTQHWAKSYKDRAARLIDEGRMHPAGLASIEAGKSSGLWSFMDDVDALIYPDDLVAAFRLQPGSGDNFAGFAPSAQRFTLRWIKLAKTDKTRQKRIAETVEAAARGAFVPGVRMPSKA